MHVDFTSYKSSPLLRIFSFFVVLGWKKGKVSLCLISLYKDSPIFKTWQQNFVKLFSGIDQIFVFCFQEWPAAEETHGCLTYSSAFLCHSYNSMKYCLFFLDKHLVFFQMTFCLSVLLSVATSADHVKKNTKKQNVSPPSSNLSPSLRCSPFPPPP